MDKIICAECLVEIGQTDNAWVMIHPSIDDIVSGILHKTTVCQKCKENNHKEIK